MNVRLLPFFPIFGLRVAILFGGSGRGSVGSLGGSRLNTDRRNISISASFTQLSRNETMMAAVSHLQFLFVSILASHIVPTTAFAASLIEPQSNVILKTKIPIAAPPSIVYTIAGSDSGGGAGIQADLKAIHSISGGTCHGCSAITCLTAQNSCGVIGVHSPPVEFLRMQLSALEGDLFPEAVKIGMLGTRDMAEEVGGWIRKLKEGSRNNERRMPLVVVDPVMISTSGHKLIDDDAKSAMIGKVFPYADLVTPNKFEAEELLGRKLRTPEDVEAGARDILAMGPRAVLMKGGHSFSEGSEEEGHSVDGKNVPSGSSQDYLLMSSDMSELGKPDKDRQRLCDGSRGVWLRGDRYETVNTHGTGCTLSSAIAAAWAMGRRERENYSSNHHDGNGSDERVGALCSMYLIDACCIAKAYVNAGIGRGVQVRFVVFDAHSVERPKSLRKIWLIRAPSSGRVPDL
jgi:hydroxymethylpyrimidine kinase/phosphomethylpyrimidine kinase